MNIQQSNLIKSSSSLRKGLIWFVTLIGVAILTVLVGCPAAGSGGGGGGRTPTPAIKLVVTGTVAIGDRVSGADVTVACGSTTISGTTGGDGTYSLTISEDAAVAVCSTSGVRVSATFTVDSTPYTLLSGRLPAATDTSVVVNVTRISDVAVRQSAGFEDNVEAGWIGNPPDSIEWGEISTNVENIAEAVGLDTGVNPIEDTFTVDIDDRLDVYEFDSDSTGIEIFIKGTPRNNPATIVAMITVTDGAIEVPTAGGEFDDLNTLKGTAKTMFPVTPISDRNVPNEVLDLTLATNMITIAIPEAVPGDAETHLSWAIYMDGETTNAPTDAAAAKTGTGSVAQSTAVTVIPDAVSGTHTFTASVSPVLTADMDYDVYIVIGNGTNATDDRLLAKEDVRTSGAAPDETDPVLGANPSASYNTVGGDVTTQTVTFTVDLSEVATISWRMVATNAPAPADVDEVKAANDLDFTNDNVAAGSVANMAQSATAQFTTDTITLVANTAYDFYLVATDAAGNDSSVQKIDNATSNDASAPTDNDPPTGWMIGAAESGSTPGTITITLTNPTGGSEAITGANYAVYRGAVANISSPPADYAAIEALEGATMNTVTAGTLAATGTFTITSLAGDGSIAMADAAVARGGSYTVYVAVKDAASNGSDVDTVGNVMTAVADITPAGGSFTAINGTKDGDIVVTLSNAPSSETIATSSYVIYRGPALGTTPNYATLNAISAVTGTTNTGDVVALGDFADDIAAGADNAQTADLEASTQYTVYVGVADDASPPNGMVLAPPITITTNDTTAPTVSGSLSSGVRNLPAPDVVNSASGASVDITLTFPDLSEDIVEYWWVVTLGPEADPTVAQVKAGQTGGGGAALQAAGPVDDTISTGSPATLTLTDVQPRGGAPFVEGTSYEIFLVGEDAADNPTRVLKGIFTADSAAPSFTGTPAASFVAAGAADDGIQNLNITFDAIGEAGMLYWLVVADAADLADNPTDIGMVKGATAELTYATGTTTNQAAGMVAVTTGTISPIEAELTNIAQDTMTDVYVVLTDSTDKDRFYRFLAVTADADATADMTAPSFTGTPAAEFFPDGPDDDGIQNIRITFDAIDENGTLRWLVRAGTEDDLADNAASIDIVKDATAQLDYGAGANANVAAGMLGVSRGTASPIEAELTNIDQGTVTDVYVVLTDSLNNDRFYRFLAVGAGADDTTAPTVSGGNLPTPTVVNSASGAGVDITLTFPNLSEDIVEYWWVVTLSRDADPNRAEVKAGQTGGGSAALQAAGPVDGTISMGSPATLTLTDVQPSGGAPFVGGTNYEIFLFGEDAANNATRVLKGIFTADTSAPSFTGTPAAIFVAAGAADDDIQDLNITFDAIDEAATLYWLVVADATDLVNAGSITTVKTAAAELAYAGGTTNQAAGMVAVTTGTISPIEAELTGIDQGTVTDVYVVLADSAGNNRFYPFANITADADGIGDVTAPSFTGTPAARFVPDGTDDNDIQDLNITFTAIDENGTLRWLVRAGAEDDLADNPASIGIVKGATAQLNYGVGANAGVAAGMEEVTTSTGSPIEAELTDIDEGTITDVYVVLTDSAGNDRFYRFLAVTADADDTTAPTVMGDVNINGGRDLPRPTVVNSASGAGIDITLTFPDLSEDIVEYWWVVALGPDADPNVAQVKDGESGGGGAALQAAGPVDGTISMGSSATLTLTDVQPRGGAPFVEGTSYEIFLVGEDAANNATRVLKGIFTADTSAPSFTGTPAASFVAAGVADDDIQDLNITFTAIDEDATLYWLVVADATDLADNAGSITTVKTAAAERAYTGGTTNQAAGMVAVTTSTGSPIAAELTGIDQGTMTDVYVVLTDRTGNDRFYPFASITADADVAADITAPSFTGTAPGAEFVTDGTDDNDIQDLNITFGAIDEAGTLYWLARAASKDDLANNSTSIGIVKNATAQLNYGAGANADVAAGMVAVTTSTASPIEAELTNIDEGTMTDVYVVLTDSLGDDRFYRFLAVRAGADNTPAPTVSGSENINGGIDLPTPTVVRALGGGVDITLTFPDLSEDIVRYWWVVTLGADPDPYRGLVKQGRSGHGGLAFQSAGRVPDTISAGADAMLTIRNLQLSGAAPFVDGTSYEIFMFGEDAGNHATNVLKGTFTFDGAAPTFESDPVGTSPGALDISIQIDLSEAGTVTYAIIPSGTDLMNHEEVVDHASKREFVTDGTSQAIVIATTDGSTPLTAVEYEVFLTATDNAGNNLANVAKVIITPTP